MAAGLYYVVAEATEFTSGTALLLLRRRGHYFVGDEMLDGLDGLGHLLFEARRDRYLARLFERDGVEVARVTGIFQASSMRGHRPQVAI